MEVIFMTDIIIHDRMSIILHWLIENIERLKDGPRGEDDCSSPSFSPLPRDQSCTVDVFEILHAETEKRKNVPG
jgi:hypothetical protein